MTVLSLLPRELAVLLIDGRSGSGKTYLARQLGDAGAQLLHLDLLYPGWGGLAHGSQSVAAALDAGRYHRYDWAAAAFEDEWTEIDPTRQLIIEGCGAITEANLAAAKRWAAGAEIPPGACALASAAAETAVRALWLECDDALRKQRALDRDGAVFAPHWDDWAAQEHAHFAAHQPWNIADQVCKISA